MGRASETAADCEVLRKHPRMTFRSGSFSYQIVREGNRSIYTVTDGVNTISEPILYCFGQGKAGQTYVFQHNGAYYESRVSFYNEIQGLDLTLGSQFATAGSLEEAAGRLMHAEDARNCFSCHNTAAVVGNQLKVDQLMTGVSCESCHGPGEKHVAAMKIGNSKEKYIFNPSTLSTDDLTQEFCAACHRGVEQVMAFPGRAGINNVRFQPYRIFNSKCYSDDRRISCTACHDPHEELRIEPAYYDAKCLACHLSKPKAIGADKRTTAASTQTAERSAPPCPVGTQQCATCHMPKIELPGAHFKFTDHRIRVVRPNEPFPP